MTLDEYQQKVQATAGGEHREERSILGLVGEAGEVAEKRKKWLRGDYGGERLKYDMDVFNELGDVLWYVAEVAIQHGWALEEVARCNLHKLADRAARGVIKGEGDDR